MKQEDWIGYFEAINGRKPTVSEFSEALRKGEFISEGAPENDVEQQDLGEDFSEQASVTSEEEPVAFSEVSKNGESFVSEGLDQKQGSETVHSGTYVALVIQSIILLLLVKAGVERSIYYIQNTQNLQGFYFRVFISTIPILFGLVIGLKGIFTKKVGRKELWLLMAITLGSIIYRFYQVTIFFAFMVNVPTFLILVIEIFKLIMLWNEKNESQSQLKPSESNNYNKPFNEFRLQKHGLWLNFILFTTASTLVFALINVASLENDTASPITALITIFVSILLSTINLIPTFISHTGWKYFIFILNIFLGPTIIGWFILLIVAISTNKNARKEQEMNYLLRKISDNVGDKNNESFE